MPTRDLERWMWAEACSLLDQAERLQRQFFDPPGRRGARAWQPPVDLYVAGNELVIMAALPGVTSERLEVGIDGGALVIAGERRLPQALRGHQVQRLEIPRGRFERRLLLPAGVYQIGHLELAHGCLTLVLHRVDSLTGEQA
ncbi:MAG: Hsp20/alpha crystallin family protein [Pseudomonadota bacterium]